jgi:predicted lipase
MRLYYFLFLFLINFISIDSFDKKTADISVKLSASAYCNKENYYIMNLSNFAKDFETKTVIYDKKTDMQGFIGILPSKQSIYIVFRGSHSLLNWIYDLEIKQTQYLSYPECKCNVHTGFYNIVNHIKTNILKQLQNIIFQYPTYNIIITGHSLGATTAELLSMELLLFGIKHENYNFGKPRVGDKLFAEFVDTKITQFRFTHYKDIVPHLVPESLQYYHSCQEIYENKHNKIKECSNINCDDPICAEQFKLIETNTRDHMLYLNHNMSCEASVSNYKELIFE